MVKAKTLLKQEKSPKNTQLKLKPNAPVRVHSSAERILNSDLVAKTILECLKNNDPEGVIEAIEIYISTLNKVQMTKQANISRSTLYSSLKGKNPTIKTLAKVVSSFEFENDARKKS